jgi:hypothetical protein
MLATTIKKLSEARAKTARQDRQLTPFNDRPDVALLRAPDSLDHILPGCRARCAKTSSNFDRNCAVSKVLDRFLKKPSACKSQALVRSQIVPRSSRKAETSSRRARPLRRKTAASFSIFKGWSNGSTFAGGESSSFAEFVCVLCVFADPPTPRLPFAFEASVVPDIFLSLFCLDLI